MRNELRARLARANDLAEARRMALREELERFIGERPKELPQDGNSDSQIKAARERDRIEHELELAEEWASATRALVDHLLGEVLGEPINPGYEDNFYNRPGPGRVVETRSDDPRARL